MTVARVRAAAWRDRGYALFYVGRFVDSLTVCERASQLLDTCVVDEYDRARVAIVFGIVVHSLFVCVIQAALTSITLWTSESALMVFVNGRFSLQLRLRSPQC